MADTLTRKTPVTMSVGGQVWNGLLQQVCARLGHHWRPYGKPRSDGYNLPHGQRDYCTRCEGQQITFRDGSVETCTKAELLACEPRFAEALYEARWGDRPRQKLWRGEWPAV
jgi:hypothetical protein